MLLQRGLEESQVSGTHGLHNRQVRRQRTPQKRQAEYAALRQVAHQQLNDDQQLVRRLVETSCHRLGRCITLHHQSVLGRTANGLLQVRMRIRIVELDSADTANIVVVARHLRIGGLGTRKRRACDEFGGLVIQVVFDHVHTQQGILNRSIRLRVVP